MIFYTLVLIAFAVPIVANYYVEYECSKGRHKTHDFEGKTICRYCGVTIR